MACLPDFSALLGLMTYIDWLMVLVSNLTLISFQDDHSLEKKWQN